MKIAMEQRIQSDSKLTARVVRAAESALEDHSYVSSLDILCGIGLLAQSHVDSWRQGRVDFLEPLIQGSPHKITSSMAIFLQWAKDKGLQPTETEYLRRTPTGTVQLRFSLSSLAEIENIYRMHFVSPSLPDRKREKLKEKLNSAPEPVVFEVVRDSECSECGAEIAQGSHLSMEAGQPLCMPCAGLGDLEFLPSGDTALTRRTTKYSSRKAVVVRFSKSRGRYERQGILAEPAAMEKAEQECTEDAGERAAARAKGDIRRREEDRELTIAMAQQISALFPGCPTQEATAIAQHTAQRSSGRVGRSAAGRKLEEKALTLAVRAAVRHGHTNYDELLAQGVERERARERVAEQIDQLIGKWRQR
jgi:hypothetical protein